jgi:phosphoribosylanthranilate isomerase
MTWIKVCGTASLADAELAIAAGADALGFLFAASPRRIEPKAAGEIIVRLPQHIAKIGVVVNASPGQVAQLAEAAGLSGAQLHGDEPAEQLAEFRSALGPRFLIKTLQAAELLTNFQALAPYLTAAKFVDAFLLDSGSAARRGGTGDVFDWSAVLPLVSRIKEEAPLIVAGGLNPENVAAAVATFRPWGVDVVSGVEGGPGTKDDAKLRAFVEAVRTGEGKGGLGLSGSQPSVYVA